MLRLRVLTAAVLLPLLLAGMFLLPGAWWQVALAVPLLAAGHEWARLASFSRAGEAAFLCALVIGEACIWCVSRPAPEHAEYAAAVRHTVYALSAAFWLVIAPGWMWRKIQVRKPLALAAAGVAVLLPNWLALVQLQSTPYLLLLLLAVVWVADIAAYFVGRALGRLKLAPAICPGKTWEGVGGAFAAVTVYAAALHFVRIPAGDLVFVGGTNDWYFRAFNAKTGELLWEQKTNSGIMGMPIAYEVDGTQYIAVQSGWGVDAQRIQDALATSNNVGVENNVPQGGVVWVFAVKK